MDNTIRIWDIGKGKCVLVLEGHTQGVHSAAFNVDGSRVVSSSADNTIRIWNAFTGVCIKVLRGHILYVSSALFFLDKNIVKLE
mmetsp:Transcript_20413/g.16867  ORF Transcript_20413/g.16867 Transcript_20413/m.16867 type:complete len:84 (-) Transcript_20413:322-573(-)